MEEKKQKGKIREYIEAILVAGLIALTIRSFVIEAFKIPSGSMIPTLSIGDHIFVNKFMYGFRIPLTKIHFLEWNTPKRGDVIVFIYPEDESVDFIKRVLGLPGDRISIHDKEVTVNGKQLSTRPLEVTPDPNDKRRLLVTHGEMKTIPFVPGWHDFTFLEETLPTGRQAFSEKKHIAQYEKFQGREDYEVVVPPHHYFVMGDNRDNSRDSREWGFVPAKNVKGKAMFVWLSLDHDQGGIRWHEFGRWVE